MRQNQKSSFNCWLCYSSKGFSDAACNGLVVCLDDERARSRDDSVRALCCPVNINPFMLIIA
jgi:hypothetical protein